MIKKMAQDPFMRSLIISATVHAALLGGGVFTPRAMHYPVAQSLSSIDVAIIHELEFQPPLDDDAVMTVSESALEEVIDKKAQELKPQQPIAEASTPIQGALSEAKPDMVFNPAPTYPQQARRNGWQGKVLLKVFVSAAGKVDQIKLEQGSGYAILDQAALNTVKRWRFKPAQIGAMPLSSVVSIPIIFLLEEK